MIEYSLPYALNVQWYTLPRIAPRSQPLTIALSIFNQTVGHNIPSGTIFERQLWVEFVVTNEREDTLFASSLLDPNGDLRTKGSEYVERGLLPPDTALVLFNGTAFRFGQMTDFFFDADAIINRTIPPHEARYARYTLPQSLLQNAVELRLSARILMRPFPPFVLRKFGHGALVERLPIFTVKSLSEKIQLAP